MFRIAAVMEGTHLCAVSIDRDGVGVFGQAMRDKRRLVPVPTLLTAPERT